MDTLSYKTRSANNEIIVKEWLIVDAENEVLGRLATQIAILLAGKHKTYYTPNLNCGDNVIVINAEKIRLTGNKMTDKVYQHYTGYPGGERFTTPKELLAKRPADVIKKAVKGMLPKNRLGNAIIKNLHISFFKFIIKND